MVIGKRGRDIAANKAMEHVAGYCVALDLTARDLQTQAKTQGLPWTAAKGFDTFCPIGEFIPKDRLGDPGQVNLWLKVNGTLRQQGSTQQMIFK